MKRHITLARIGLAYRAYRKVRDKIDREFAGSTICMLFSLALLALPFILYADLDGTWSQMLAQFTDHMTPLDVKITRYLDFLKHTPSWHLFLKLIVAALALDAITIAVRFTLWWRASSAPSPQS